MIEIVEYVPSWPQEFEALADSLRTALGALALQIDHVGSTAVPGLCAKDVIDIQITVAAIDKAVTTAISQTGFVCLAMVNSDHVPPGMSDSPEDWAKLFFRSAPGRRRAHVHVRCLGAANQRYTLLFRDFLRASPATAKAYGELKHRLAKSLAQAESYPEVKDPAVDLIYFAAEQWAQATHWQANRSAGMAEDQ